MAKFSLAFHANVVISFDFKNQMISINDNGAYDVHVIRSILRSIFLPLNIDMLDLYLCKSDLHQVIFKITDEATMVAMKLCLLTEGIKIVDEI